MSWFLVDDRFHAHPKAYRCSLRALGLWVKAGSWCQEHLTDGFVPIEIVSQLKGGEKTAGSRLANELTQAGLWIAVEGGWRFHEWTAFQGSRDEILARRAQEARRKAEYRAGLANRTHNGVRPDNRPALSAVRTDAGGTPAVFRAESARSPSVPLLSSPSPSPSPEERDPDLKPQIQSLQVVRACELGSGGVADEMSQAAGAAEAQYWLNEILLQCCTSYAPRLGGKWTAAYRYIGAQPAGEWTRVEAALRSELTSGRLKARFCTPGHVADYWAAYASGEPPGGGNGPSRKGAGPVGTLDDFAREARTDPQPEWLEDV